MKIMKRAAVLMRFVKHKCNLVASKMIKEYHISDFVHHKGKAFLNNITHKMFETSAVARMLAKH